MSTSSMQAITVGDKVGAMAAIVMVTPSGRPLSVVTDGIQFEVTRLWTDRVHGRFYEAKAAGPDDRVKLARASVDPRNAAPPLDEDYFIWAGGLVGRGGAERVYFSEGQVSILG